MARKRTLAAKAHFRYPRGDAVAEIYVMGKEPWKKLATGRRSVPIGRPVMIKAGMRAIEWESIRAEKPMYELCEIATPVHSMFAQPHELVMWIAGRREPMIYQPDLRLEVDARFAKKIDLGIPFIDAVRTWQPRRGDHLTTMIVEVKDDDDPRNDNEEYQHKLRLAKLAYAKFGYSFLVVKKSKDIIDPRMTSAVARLFRKRKSRFLAGDISAVAKAFEDREVLDWQDVVSALGKGPVASAKACAMHVRRFIQVDLSGPIGPTSKVRHVDDDRPVYMPSLGRQ